MSNSLLRVQFEDLPAGKTRDEVIHFFYSGDGRITDIDLSTDGVAVVTFATADDADRLLKNPPIVDGVPLKARRCSPKKLAAFVGITDPKKLPLPAVTSPPEKKVSILRERLQTRPTSLTSSPRVQSCTFPARVHPADNSNDTRSSKVQTVLIPHTPQRHQDGVDENGNSEKLCWKDKELSSADSCASPAVCPSSKPRSKSEHDIERTKQEATAVNILTSADASVQQIEQVIPESDKSETFVKGSTEPSIKELRIISERIELIRVLMDANVLDLTGLDCHVTCDEHNEKIILTGHNCNEVEIRIQERLDAMVSGVIPMANRFLQTTKGENWIRTETRKLGLLSVYYTEDKAAMVLAKDEDCLRDTVEVLSDILDSEKIYFGNDYFIESKWNDMVRMLHSSYMVLVETDFDTREITVEGSANDLEMVTCLINASIKDSSECSRIVPPDEVAAIKDSSECSRNVPLDEIAAIKDNSECSRNAPLDEIAAIKDNSECSRNVSLDEIAAIKDNSECSRNVSLDEIAAIKDNSDCSRIIPLDKIAAIKDNSDCSENVSLDEIAGSLLNKFQNEIRHFIDNELSLLQMKVKVIFKPRCLEIVGWMRDVEAAEKLIGNQFIMPIQQDRLTDDELGGSIENFKRKDSFEAFTVQKLEENYRCVIRIDDSCKQQYRFKAEEALRSSSNITVVKGDITRFTDADVLVNSIACETSDLRKAGVISLAFMNAGNEALQQEFQEARTPIFFGCGVTVTGPAGTIRAKRIYHVAIRKYQNEESIELFTRMISTCLRKAEEENMTSIAFPTLGCGKLQYKCCDVVNCFVEAARGSKLQIYIVALTDEMYEEFREYLAASHQPDVSKLPPTVNADTNTPEKPQSVLRIFSLDASINTKVKEELKSRCCSQPPASQVITEVLMEMHIFHQAIATLPGEIIRRIQSLQTSELQVAVDARQSTVTLTGKRKQDIGEVKQRILKLIAEHELQQKNLSYIKKTRGHGDYLMALSATHHLGFPPYWTNYGVTDLSKAVETRQLLTKGSWQYNAVEAILLETWKPSLAMLGRDARNLSHTGIEVVNIWVNENPQNYTKYQSQLKSLAARAAKKPFKSITDLTGEPKIMTRLVNGSVSDLNDQLISEVNEEYLLHGTIHVDEIVKNGIDSRFCGDKVLFGKGAYFAESSTKANQYADPKYQRSQDGQPLHMFVARVLLGEPFLCQKARSDLKKAPCSTFGCESDSCTKHPMSDSVVGTHAHIGTPLLFREFIVYHPDQCYPEFLVQYKRK